MRNQTLVINEVENDVTLSIEEESKENKNVDRGEAVEEEQKPAIKCPMSHLLVDSGGKELSSGECTASIDREYLSVFLKFGDILPFHLRDIMEIRGEDYRISLSLSSMEKLTLFGLGEHFEDFLRTLTDLRNEMMIKDLLLNESVKKSDVEMEFIHYGDDWIQRESGGCKIRLYETGLVVLPQRDDVFRVPYSDVTKVSVEEFSVRIGLESGGSLLLSKLGSEFDPFLKSLSDILSELQQKTASSLKNLLPQIDPVSLRRIANIMRDGKAVRRLDIDAISPKVWAEFEKRIASFGLGEEFSFLKSLARGERVCIGYKRDLLGNLTGEYIWFLMPVYGVGDMAPGNAIAMEAVEDKGTGKATYFFRITGRAEYNGYKGIEELDREADRQIKMINRCMIDINFRREPIYLPEERLDEPAYLKYKIAVQKIPSLKTLRALYIGRVVHASLEQWKSDVTSLLKQNVMLADDSIRIVK